MDISLVSSIFFKTCREIARKVYIFPLGLTNVKLRFKIRKTVEYF